MTETASAGLESRIGELWKGLTFFTVLQIILVGLTGVALVSGLLPLSRAESWPEVGQVVVRALISAAVPATLALAMGHLRGLFRSVLVALEELRTTV